MEHCRRCESAAARAKRFLMKNTAGVCVLCRLWAFWASARNFRLPGHLWPNGPHPRGRRGDRLPSPATSEYRSSGGGENARGCGGAGEVAVEICMSSLLLVGNIPGRASTWRGGGVGRRSGAKRAVPHCASSRKQRFADIDNRSRRLRGHQPFVVRRVLQIECGKMVA